jgi:hypothetical protein
MSKINPQGRILSILTGSRRKTLLAMAIATAAGALGTSANAAVIDWLAAGASPYPSEVSRWLPAFC